MRILASVCVCVSVCMWVCAYTVHSFNIIILHSRYIRVYIYKYLQQKYNTTR